MISRIRRTGVDGTCDMGGARGVSGQGQSMVGWIQLLVLVQVDSEGVNRGEGPGGAKLLDSGGCFW